MALQFPALESDEVRNIRAEVCHFLDKHVSPYVAEDDKNCFFRREMFAQFCHAGLNGLFLPHSLGGRALSYQCYYASLVEIARVSVSLSITIGVTNLVQGALLAFGSLEQKERFLKPMLSGKILGAFSLSESHSGSDAASLKLKATMAPGGHRLTGTKMWCSTAGHADLYLVIARTGEDKHHGITAFLIEKDAPGFRVGKMERKLGLRSSSLAELILEDCFVPDNQTLGKIGEGFKVGISQLEGGRIAIASSGIGVTVEALEWVCQLMAASDTSEETLSAGAFYLMADSFAMVTALKLLLLEAGRTRDLGKELTTIAAQLKLLASDLAVKTASDAITLVGEKAVTPHYPFERLLRDAKALQIVEGTNQIQRLVLSRKMKEMSKKRKS